MDFGGPGGREVVRTLVVAVILGLLIALVSLDFKPEQEAFNRGAIYLTAGIAVGYGVAALALLRGRAVFRGRDWFIRYGGVLLLLAGLLAYTVIMSVKLERIL